MVPTQNLAVVAKGLARFTQIFKNQPNVLGITTALLGPFQELENAFWSVISGRILSNNPTGDMLDKIGALVGEPRLGRPDGIYLYFLRVRIRINRSRGRAEDIIQLVNLIAPGATSTYTESYPLKFAVTSYAQGYGLTPLTLEALSQAKAAGSKGFFYYSPQPKAQVFRFSSVSGGVSSPGLFDTVQFPRVTGAGRLAALETTP